MIKTAFKMKLKPGYAAEYKRRHDEIWPELLELLRQAGISDYSIYLDEETNILFAVQRLSPCDAVNELSADPVMRRWWAHMADIMAANPDGSPVTAPLDEVFYLE